MKIGAYQFRVTGDAERNYGRMKIAAEEAHEAGVRLLVFPECAVTGYPPRDISSALEADLEAAERVHARLQALADRYDMFLTVGTIIKEGNRHFDAAMVFSPGGGRTVYRKRALWGWDRENFRPGSDAGVMEAGGLRIGVRICFEARFPEYFRELYRARTDLDIILFYDVTDSDDPERREVIRGHVRTRAAENVCHILTCNTASPRQSAPTGLYDRSGRTLAELESGKEGLMAFDLEITPMDFGETGRKDISDALTGMSTRLH